MPLPGSDTDTVLLTRLLTVLTAATLLSGCASTGEFQNQEPTIDVAQAQAQLLFDTLTATVDAKYGSTTQDEAEYNGNYNSYSGRTMCESGLPWTRFIQQVYPEPVPGYASFEARSKYYFWPVASSPTPENLTATLAPIIDAAGYTTIQTPSNELTNSRHDSVWVRYNYEAPGTTGRANNGLEIIVNLACYPTTLE